MKKIYFLCVIAFVFSVNLNAAKTRVSLAEWTFDWCTPAVAATTSKVVAVAPDRGAQVTTALLATENIAGSGRGFSWPSSTGYYVYSTNWNSLTPEKYWWVYGLNTTGCTNIQISSKHSNSTTTPNYALKIQYRIGGETGTWTDFYGPFDVTKTVTLNNATAIGDGPTPETPAILPTACEEQSSLEIRYLLTTAALASGVQVRLDAVIVSAMMETTGINKKEECPTIKVLAVNGKLAITGAAGLNVKVYNLTGSKVLELQNIKAIEETALSSGQIYIVKVNNKAYKVHL